MERDQMLRLFEAHREAEAARDIDGILKTFVSDPFLETAGCLGWHRAERVPPPAGNQSREIEGTD